MKSNRRKNKKIKIFKTIISFILVFAMVMDCFPASVFDDVLQDIFKVARKVQAAGSGTPISLDSKKALEEYAQNYDSSNANDILEISISDGGVGGAFSDFITIADSEEEAFNGTIMIDSTAVLRLPETMFGYITDDVTITDLNGNPTTLVFARTEPTSDQPLFAKHVIHARDTGNVVDWSFRYDRYYNPEFNSNYMYDFAGYIGSIEASANVKISSITHNNKSDDVIANIVATGDAGLVCGTLGEGASLEIDSIIIAEDEISTMDYTVTSSSEGNAGGLVGSMGDGSRLILGTSLVNPQNPSKSITAVSGYAGGIVGKCDGGTIVFSNTSAYSLSQVINGSLGSGAVAGYYSTVSSNADISDLDRYTISTNYFSITNTCKVNGAGECGGIFGEVINDGNMTITGTNGVATDHSSGSSASFGGLIGKYTAEELADSLSINVSGTVAPSKTGGTVSQYGGAIGIVVSNDETNTNAAYVEISNIYVSASNANAGTNFGGVIGKAEESFVNLSGTNTIGYSGTSSSTTFAGVVGDLSNGVLYLQGTTDLSGAPAVSSAANSSGQVVGYRQRGLVFAADGWTMARTSNDQKLDDIGSWGEIVRFNNSSLIQSNILSVDLTAHTVTLEPAVDEMENLTDFAKTALNMQVNNGQTTGVLLCSGSTESDLLETDLSLKLNSGNPITIDLRGTGITGLTRDGSPSGLSLAPYAATFDGNGGTIILATGEEYFTNGTEGNGSIYRHEYNGLFGKTEGATIQNLNISENSVISVKAQRAMYAGNIIGQAKGALTIDNVNVKNNGANYATINAGGTAGVNVGGMIGNLTGAGTVQIENSEYNGNISTSASNSITGALIGSVNSSNTFNISLKDTNIKGGITTTAGKTGGTIGVIEPTGSNTSNKSTGRILTIDNLAIDGLTMDVTGTSGGVLGYGWYETDVIFTSAAGLDVINSSSLTATGDTAGLCYEATGYWKVNTGSINLSSMSVTADSATDFGLLINKGYYDGGTDWSATGNGKSSAIYLELDSKGFSVTKAGVDISLSSVTVFDELVAYSANGSVMDNGQGIVSINTYDGTNSTSSLLKMGSSDVTNTGITYQHQTSFLDTNSGLINNPNTRYYYNLDDYRTTPSDDKQKLLIWSVKKYAHPSVRGYFDPSNTIGSSVGSANSDLDMLGYSYYPIDLTESFTISGDLKLHNSEFDATEGARSDNRESTEQAQHYFIHNGLFRNVTGTLNVNDLDFDGKVNSIDGYCGSLIMGTLSSDSSANPAKVNINGLVLDGIKIDGTVGESDFKPLLINNAGSNVVIDINNVSNNSTSYTNTGSGASLYIASSLLGTIGSSSSTGVILNFSGIKLDGRNSSGATNLSALDNVYHSKGSLFSKSTLVDTFSYANNSGSYGVYNYTQDEDWGEENNTAKRKVTYGYEIIGTVENWDTENDVSKQRKYNGSSVFTNPTTDNASSQYDHFTDYFQRYVNTPYVSGETNHELRVNISVETTMTGCGTYNDPYVIKTGEDIENIAKIINGTFADTSGAFKINVPNSVDNNNKSATWCENKNSHTQYSLANRAAGDRDSSLWAVVGESSTIKDSTLGEYLAGAYYQLDTNITGNYVLSNNFSGISNCEENEYIFRGVIDGTGHTIVNKSNNPLIISSYGSVVYNLTVDVQPDTPKQLTQKDTKVFTTDNSNQSTSCEAYGAVIGKIFGGDNIIDSVSVKFSSEKKIINANSASKAQLVPIGGYVGVVINGGLIFRNMTGTSINNQAGLTAEALDGFGTGVGQTPSDPTTADNTKWLYVNPIIGRVLNGYAITESTSYKPFENGTRTYPDGSGVIFNGTGYSEIEDMDNYSGSPVGVTMHNGTKNYSIADISTNDTSSFNMTGTEDDSDIKVSNAQGLYIMSLITQSGLGKSTTGAYKQIDELKPYDSYMATHNEANYHYVGGTGSDMTTDYDKTLSDKYVGTTGKLPYIIKKYTNTLTLNSSTVYPAFNVMGDKRQFFNLILDTDSITTFYLPDSYRGIGSLMSGVNRSSGNLDDFKDNVIFLYSMAGNNNIVSENMNLTIYADDNYPVMSGDQAFFKTGFGFIDCMQSKTKSGKSFKELTIKGSVSYALIEQTSGKHVDYNNNYVNDGRKNNPAVAAFIGVPVAEKSSNPTAYNVSIESIDIDSMDISGIRYAGGFIGALNVAGKFTFKDCNVDDIKVLAGGAAGGLMGYMRNGSAKIEVTDCEFGIISIISAKTGSADLGANSNAGAGGLIGNRQSGSSANETNLTFSNVTVKNGSSVDKGYIGYYNDGLSANSKSNPTIPSAGGLVGNSNQTSRISADNVTITNLDICGVYAGGMLGYILGSNSQATFNNSSVNTDNNCKIESLYDNDNSASGGFIGRSDANGISGDAYSLMFDNCSVKNYTLSSYRNTGGLIGYNYGSKSVIANNITVENETLKANNRAGGMIGYLNNGSLNGYNILIKNQTAIKNTTSSISSNGYIVGYNSSKAIKIAGFSRQGTIDTAKMVGNSNSTNSETYGTDGYVVFADYKDTASDENPNKMFSNMQTVGTNVGVSAAVGSKTVETTYQIIAHRDNGTLVIDNVDSSSVETNISSEVIDDLGYGESQLISSTGNKTAYIGGGSNILTNVDEFDVTTNPRAAGGFYISLDDIKNSNIWANKSTEGPYYLTTSLGCKKTPNGLIETNENDYPTSSQTWYSGTYSKAIWIVEKDSSGYYKIKDSATGRYITSTNTDNQIALDTNTADLFEINTGNFENFFWITKRWNTGDISTNKDKRFQHSNGGECARYYKDPPSSGDEYNGNFKFTYVTTAVPELKYSEYDNISYNGTTVTNSSALSVTSADESQTSTYDNILSDGGYINTDKNYEVYNIVETVKMNIYGDINASPYVTTNPKTDITSTQFLTSDGVSGNSYISSSASSIINDIRSSSKKGYQYTNISTADLNALSSTLQTNMTTIKSASNGNVENYNGEDFPVLIIDDISSANTVINNYLRLLTNTNYNFAKGYSNGTTFTGDDRDIYNVSITKWKYNDTEGKFVKQDGAASLKCRVNDRFYITAGESDNEDWQISLVDVQFYDPSNVRSTTTDGLIAYHLYVPVIVRKMLHYDFTVRPASGTTYSLDSYPTSIANVVENLGNPITMKVTYTYRQNAEDWTAAINSGERVYRYYNKILELTSYGTFPEDALIVLVDPNNNADKYYSMEFAEKNESSGVFVEARTEAGSTTYTMNMDAFTYPDSFVYPTLNDLMTISLDDAATEKNLVEWDENDDPSEIVAEINDGGSNDGMKLRLASEEEVGTRYAVSVSLKDYDSSSGFLQENYYLSIFTKEDKDDDDIYHYAVSCSGNTLGAAHSSVTGDELSYPTAKVTQETTHLFLGNIYTNTVTIDENNRTRLMSKDNDTLDVTLTAKVGFTESAIRNNITTYTTNRNVHIYQNFMFSLNRLNGNSANQRGILVNPANVVQSEYAVAGDDSHSSNLERYVIYDSYIELPSSYNIKGELKTAAENPTVVDGENDYTITITERVAIKYLDGALSAQFPESTADSTTVGTYVVGYSNISSAWESASSSRASDNTDKLKTGTDRLLYYIEDDSTVIFTYNASTNPDFEDDGNGNYGQLGINGLELDEAEKDYIQVNTAGYYNIYSYNQKQFANYVKITVQLSKKDDGYTEALNIPTYLSDFKILDINGDEITQIDASGDDPGNDTTVIKNDSSNIYTYIIPLSRLKTLSQDAYTIPITFKAYSGDNIRFEDANTGNNTSSDMQYSNYKVLIKVGLLATRNNNEAVLNNSDKYDHVIYTNAKVISEVIDTSGD